MGKVLKSIKAGNLSIAPLKVSSTFWRSDPDEGRSMSAFEYSSLNPEDYAQLALYQKYLGEVREEFGLSSKPFIWEEDNRPAIIEEPHLLQSIPEFFIALIAKAKSDPAHHYFLDSSLGSFDCDGYTDLSDSETMFKIMLGTHRAMEKAKEEFSQLEEEELYEIGLPIMESIEDYKSQYFRTHRNEIIASLSSRKPKIELQYLGKEAREDLDVVLAAISSDPYLVRFAGEKLGKVQDSVKKLVYATPYAYEIIDQKYHNDPQICGIALRGYTDRGHSLSSEVSYEYNPYEDDPAYSPYTVTTEFGYLVDGNRKLIQESIGNKNQVFTERNGATYLTKPAQRALKSILKKEKSKTKHEKSEFLEIAGETTLDEYEETIEELKSKNEKDKESQTHNNQDL